MRKKSSKPFVISLLIVSIVAIILISGNQIGKIIILPAYEEQQRLDCDVKIKACAFGVNSTLGKLYATNLGWGDWTELVYYLRDKSSAADIFTYLNWDYLHNVDKLDLFQLVSDDGDILYGGFRPIGTSSNKDIPPVPLDRYEREDILYIDLRRLYLLFRVEELDHIGQRLYWKYIDAPYDGRLACVI